MEIPYFWAKTDKNKNPGVSVRGHCFNVAYVAYELAEQFAILLRQWDITPDLAAFLAGTHDCGKISWHFQSLCGAWREKASVFLDVKKPRPSPKPPLHGEVSRDAINRFLLLNRMTNCESAALWASMIGAHHGRLSQWQMPSDRGPRVHDKSEPIWEDSRQGLINELAGRFKISKIPDITYASPSLWYLGGLISLADWIGSDEAFFPPDKDLPDEDAKIQASKAVTALKIAPLAVKEDLSFTSIFGFSTNIFQEKAVEFVNGPGLYVLEAPMGMGKTEAAFWIAWKLISKHKATGIYFALPTQATSNSIWKRMQEFADSICTEHRQTQIIHGNAWMIKRTYPGTDLTLNINMASSNPEEIDDNPGERWFSSAKRALFAPLGVGTIDQALMGALAVRHFFMRRFALAGKVVVLDEIHSYDAYTSELVIELCRILVQLGSTVIVLSATLTDVMRDKILGRKINCKRATSPIRLSAVPTGSEPACESLFLDSTKTVNVGWEERDTLIEKMVQAAKRGACVLWICDTVDSAQETCSQLINRGQLPDDAIGLLHSRFPAFRRADLENYWLKRLGKGEDKRSGCILVATQVVEQSVDIDADILVTELAPTDMLLQRLGRLQRHDRGPRRWPAQCWLICENLVLDDSKNMAPKAIRNALGAKSYVYRPDLLLRTLRVWLPLKQISLPGDMRNLLEQTYAEDDMPPSWEELCLEWKGREEAEKYLARSNTNIWTIPAKNDEDIQLISTRLGRYESENVVLFSCKTENLITLISGDTIEISNKIVTFKNKCLLIKNTVRIQKSKLYDIYPMEIGNIKYNFLKIQTKDNNKGIIYSEKLGLFL